MSSETRQSGPAEPLRADEIEAFVEALLQARAQRRPAQLPEGFAQRCSPAQAREIAAAHMARVLEQHGGRVAGAKLGATNAEAMARLGLARPFTGPVFSAAMIAGPARLPRSDFLACVIEAEVAVRFGAPIGGSGAPPSREALVAAIDALFPVIEIADCRLAGFPALPPVAIAADLGFAGALVTGVPVADWRRHDLAALRATLSVNGEQVREGAGAAVMGNPLDALAQYVAELGESGRAVAAGEIVSTGTWTAPWFGQAGERIVADFGPLGRVELELV